MKSVEELKRMKQGSAEESPITQRAGWYKYVFPEGHVNEQGEPEPFVRVLAVEHPKFGNTQADAYVRVGYVFDGEATAEEIMAAAPNIVDDRQTHSTGNAVQAAPAADTVPRAEFEELKARLEAIEGTDGSNADGANDAPEKPLKDWNKTQLMAKAGELEIEVPEGATNKQIVELIEAAGQ